jgi:MFS family permease
MAPPSPLSPRRVLVPLGIGTGLSLLGDATLYVVLPNPAIAAQMGVTLGMVGILLGANRLVRIPFNPPVGMLYDRLPRRGLLVTALFIGACSTALYAVGSGLWSLLVGRLLWGMAWSGIWIGGNTVVLDIADDHNRGRLSGRYQMWFLMGVASASLLGGIFTDWLGFRGGLWLSAGLTALGAITWWIFLPETRPARMETNGPQRGAPGGPFPWRIVLPIAVPFFALRFVIGGMFYATTNPWLSTFVGEGTTLAGLFLPIATLTGILAATRAIISVLSAPLGGRLSDRLGQRWPVIAASAALGAAGGWLMGGTGLALAFVGTAGVAVAGGVIQALAPALAGDRVSPTQHSRALSGVFTVGDFASAIGPPLAFWLLPLTSIGWLCRLCAGVFGVVALFALRWAVSERRGER